MADETWDLTRALTELGVLMLTQQSLQQDLERIARIACALIPTAAAASFALLIDGVPSTAAVSDHVALELDLAQIKTEEGPCLRALNGNSVRVGFLAMNEEFPHFAICAADQRIHSVLSIPIKATGEVLGTMNIYGTTADAFSEDDHRVGAVLAAEAGNALARSAVLHGARRIRDLLQTGYDEHMIVSRAEGVLIAVQQCSAGQATELLRNAAKSHGEEIVDVATRIIAAVQPPTDPSAEAGVTGSGLPEKT